MDIRTHAHRRAHTEPLSHSPSASHTIQPPRPLARPWQSDRMLQGMALGRMALGRMALGRMALGRAPDKRMGSAGTTSVCSCGGMYTCVAILLAHGTHTIARRWARTTPYPSGSTAWSRHGISSWAPRAVTPQCRSSTHHRRRAVEVRRACVLCLCAGQQPRPRRPDARDWRMGWGGRRGCSNNPCALRWHGPGRTGRVATARSVLCAEIGASPSRTSVAVRRRSMHPFRL